MVLLIYRTVLVVLSNTMFVLARVVLMFSIQETLQNIVTESFGALMRTKGTGTENHLGRCLRGVHTLTSYVNVLFYRNSFCYANAAICKIYSVNYISLFKVLKYSFLHAIPNFFIWPISNLPRLGSIRN